MPPCPAAPPPTPRSPTAPGGQIPGGEDPWLGGRWFGYRWLGESQRGRGQMPAAPLVGGTCLSAAGCRWWLRWDRPAGVGGWQGAGVVALVLCRWCRPAGDIRQSRSCKCPLEVVYALGASRWAWSSGRRQVGVVKWASSSACARSAECLCDTCDPCLIAEFDSRWAAAGTTICTGRRRPVMKRPVMKKGAGPCP